MRPEKIIPDNPKIGVVIGTMASVPYIHLGLEARARFYPDIPCLIHDDCSTEQVRLNDLCCQYGADFSFSTTSLGHIFGDCSVFWSGLLWAKRQGLDILVKLSRRFIPLNDFRPSLVELAVKSQYATYSNECRTWGFGFRTESIAMHVDTWLSQHQIADFRDRTARNDMLNGLPESFFHTWAMNVHPPCSACAEYERQNPQRHGAYGQWDWIGVGRGIKNDNFLWHNSSRLADYHKLARQWGLDYSARDFAV